MLNKNNRLWYDPNSVSRCMNMSKTSNTNSDCHCVFYIFKNCIKQITILIIRKNACICKNTNSLHGTVNANYNTDKYY